MTIISLENISVAYKDKKTKEEKQIVENFNLKVEKGESVALIGKSGAGKSTLLNIIGLLENPNDGNVYIHNTNVKASNRNRKKYYKKTISYLFQNFALLDAETVEHNLMISNSVSNKNMKQKMIKKALEEVGLSGYEKTKVFQLSGGEQQRVALARILMKSSEIILADEPTGSLDAENRKVILDILEKFKKRGKTIIIVTHDPEVAKWCDRMEIIRKP